jgi:hypothetical protein
VVHLVSQAKDELLKKNTEVNKHRLQSLLELGEWPGGWGKACSVAVVSALPRPVLSICTCPRARWCSDVPACSAVCLQRHACGAACCQASGDLHMPPALLKPYGSRDLPPCCRAAVRTSSVANDSYADSLCFLLKGDRTMKLARHVSSFNTKVSRGACSALVPASVVLCCAAAAVPTVLGAYQHKAD